MRREYGRSAPRMLGWRKVGRSLGNNGRTIEPKAQMMNRKYGRYVIGVPIFALIYAALIGSLWTFAFLLGDMGYQADWGHPVLTAVVGGPLIVLSFPLMYLADFLPEDITWILLAANALIWGFVATWATGVVARRRHEGRFGWPDIAWITPLGILLASAALISVLVGVKMLGLIATAACVVLVLVWLVVCWKLSRP